MWCVAKHKTYHFVLPSPSAHPACACTVQSIFSCVYRKAKISMFYSSDKSTKALGFFQPLIEVSLSTDIIATRSCLIELFLRWRMNFTDKSCCVAPKIAKKNTASQKIISKNYIWYIVNSTVYTEGYKYILYILQINIVNYEWFWISGNNRYSKLFTAKESEAHKYKLNMYYIHKFALQNNTPPPRSAQTLWIYTLII